jgi:hypothetical protein
VTAPYRTNVDESAEPRPTSVKSTVFKFHWE